MTPLRRRMTEELQLRGYAARTIQTYLGVVAQLARFYHTSPEGLTEAQVRDYLLHLSTVRKLAPSSFTLALCGIKFLYEQTQRRALIDTQLEALEIVRAMKLAGEICIYTNTNHGSGNGVAYPGILLDRQRLSLAVFCASCHRSRYGTSLRCSFHSRAL